MLIAELTDEAEEQVTFLRLTLAEWTAFPFQGWLSRTTVYNQHGGSAPAPQLVKQKTMLKGASTGCDKTTPISSWFAVSLDWLCAGGHARPWSLSQIHPKYTTCEINNTSKAAPVKPILRLKNGWFHDQCVMLQTVYSWKNTGRLQSLCLPKEFYLILSKRPGLIVRQHAEVSSLHVNIHGLKERNIKARTGHFISKEI